MEKVLMTASVASMIDLFNWDNIRILQQMGKEVHVAANFKFGSVTSQQRVDQFRKELEEAGVIVHHLPFPRRMGAVKEMMQSYRGLKKLMEENRFQMVYTQTPIGGVLTRLAARKHHKKGMKVMYAAHGFHFFKGAPLMNWLLFYPIERICARFTDVLLTMNQEDYQRAQNFPAKEIAYIPGVGLELKKFEKENNHVDQTMIRQKFGLTKEDYILMSVGELTRRKNQETVIRAMALIPDSSIKYCIVGMGEYEEFFRQLIKELQLENRVYLLGYSSKVSRMLQMADCFIFPSLQEGLPVALMEAMAATKPVICSQIRGNTDLIEHKKSGLLVEAKDENGYAKAIMAMYQNPQKALEFARQARKKVEGFSKERVNEKMRELYEEMLER
ncbi:MAG: glycosyltransferase family 4 protein [Lachnospiraceae bacterium]